MSQKNGSPDAEKRIHSLAALLIDLAEREEAGLQPVPPAESRSATFRDLEERGLLDELREARVIFVQDLASKQQHLVFGRRLLAELVATGEKREGLLAYAVELDIASDEMTRLLEFIKDIHGYHDFQ